MAKSSLKNPRFYAGPILQKDTVRALDGQTWKSGQPGWFDSGYARPIITDGTNVKFVFSSDQDTAASTSDVKIERIPSAATQFVGYISSDDSDTDAQRAHLLQDYGIHVGSNVATVNVNETSSVAVLVDKLLWLEEPLKNASTDSAGQVIFHYKQSVLDA